jgi:hypothetical protein
MKRLIAYALPILVLLTMLPVLSPVTAEAALGDFLFKWGSYGTGDEQFYWPYDVATDASGNVYVVDFRNHRVQVFDSNGTFLRKWGSGGNGDGQFGNPTAIAVNEEGKLYVGDGNNIQVFDSNGNFIRGWGSYGSGDGQFVCVWGIAFDSDGNVYVADGQNRRVQVFDSNGTFLRKWGSHGASGRGRFFFPTDIAVDGNNNVYVIDLFFVQVFDSNGTFIRQWSPFSKFSLGMTVDKNGLIYSTGYDQGYINAVKVFDSYGTLLGQWGTFGTGDGQFFNHQGISIAGNGNVYVADTRNNRIQVFGGLGGAAPTANAGPDQTVSCSGPSGSSVTLDGSQSSDPDGDTITYTWTGPFGTATGASPTVSLPLGTHTITLTVDDGNDGTDTDTVEITVADTTPPSTLAVLDGTMGQNDWFVSDVIVTLIATDNCSGVKEVHYAIDGVEQPAVSDSTAVFIIAEDGAHTLTYWAVDNALNTEQAASTPVNTETTPPDTTSTPSGTGGSGGHYTSCVSVELTVTESSSGSSETYYRLDDTQDWEPYTGQFTICTEGETTVSYRTTSNAGNVEDIKTLLINIDQTPPEIVAHVSPDANASGWHNSDVTVTFTCTDATSGIATCEDPIIITTEDTGQVVTGTAVDVAGNTASTSVTLDIDKTAPSITITGISEGTKYPACSPPTPAHEATDPLSGLSSSSDTLTGGNANGVGTYSYEVTASDIAGNTAVETVTYKVVYTFEGFQNPVTLDRPFKLGSTIPVKFSLNNGCGSLVPDATATLSLQVLSGSEPSGDPIDGSSNVPDSGNIFRYVPEDNHYIYNLSTDILSVGTWQATVTLDDTEAHTINIGIK